MLPKRTKVGETKISVIGTMRLHAGLRLRWEDMALDLSWLGLERNAEARYDSDVRLSCP